MTNRGEEKMNRLAPLGFYWWTNIVIHDESSLLDVAQRCSENCRILPQAYDYEGILCPEYKSFYIRKGYTVNPFCEDYIDIVREVSNVVTRNISAG